MTVNTDTDELLRAYLTDRGCTTKQAFSRFVADAVRAHILELTAAEIKATMRVDFDEQALETLVDDAVAWARAGPCAS